MRQATIFVVEDDQDVLVSLRFLLETEGFNVRTFASGPALLADGLPGPGDCLVVDYKMAEMDGFELIERLRGQRVSAPVVLVTAYPGPAVSARAESSGVRHIVPQAAYRRQSDRPRAGGDARGASRLNRPPGKPLGLHPKFPGPDDAPRLQVSAVSRR